MNQATINATSCVSCQLRKVRCNRMLPRCKTCTSRNTECVYEPRKKRTINLATPREHSPTKRRQHEKRDHAESSTILHRFSHVEEQTRSPERALSAKEVNLSFVGTTHVPSCTTIPTLLKAAVYQVRKKKLRDVSHAIAMRDSIALRPDLVRVWINNYFNLTHNKIFLRFVDRRLMELVPDLLNMNQVHLEASVLVTYYGILFRGCAIPDNGASCDQHQIRYHESRKLYALALRALPAWQREATGSKHDFVAAVIMTRAATESFDFDLAFKLYELACNYAQSLGIHHLDSQDGLCALSDSATDTERKGFWELFQIGFFFRLFLEKPRVMNMDMAKWRVNLPYLSTEIALEGDIGPVIFAINSRITHIISDYLDLQEKSDGNRTAHFVSHVESLCQDANFLYEDWQIDKMFHQALKSDTRVNAWLVADGALAILASIVRMLAQIEAAESPLAMNASRRLLKISYAVLTHWPSSEILTVIFGVYQVHVAFASIAQQLLQSPPEEALLDELARIRDAVAVVVDHDKDFLPLLQALRDTCSYVHEKMY